MQLVLFDIDGTLLRYRNRIAAGIFMKAVSREFDVDVRHEHLPSFAGMTDLLILKLIGENVGVAYYMILDRLDSIKDYILTEFSKFSSKDDFILMPGVVELLDELQKDDSIQLGLLTGNFIENAYHKLTVLGLDKYFPIGAFGNDHYIRAELPEFAINRANEIYGKQIFTRSNSIIIGDADKDVECAKINRMPVIAVATGTFSLDDLAECSPDYLFHNLSNKEIVISAIKELEDRDKN